ncbi:MAG TPA: J domain-containing protein [Spirochaetales bacterium]|nr:J domain-containing protein [Spirochaetales bacterium]
MDQIFDRLGNLLKSWLNNDIDTEPSSSGQGSRTGQSTRSGDPLLDDAMDELDAFLDDDKQKQERLTREREARARAEEAARARPSGPSGPPKKLVDAYKTMGLSYGAPFESVRSAYKKLLKEHHPDRHGHSPEALKKATETSARINNAYRLIETWHETGSLADE